MRKLIFVAALAALLAAAVVTAPLAFGTTKTVALKDVFFSPKSLTISRGTTVKFVWRGQLPHNVVVRKGPVRFRSPNKLSGTYSHRFRRAGRYLLVCTIHPGMAMTVRVK